MNVSIRSRLLCREMRKPSGIQTSIYSFNPLSAVMPRDAHDIFTVNVLIAGFNPLSAVMPRDAFSDFSIAVFKDVSIRSRLLCREML